MGRKDEYKYPVNSNKWCYTTSKTRANRKVKRARRKQIRQYFKKELRKGIYE